MSDRYNLPAQMRVSKTDNRRKQATRWRWPRPHFPSPERRPNATLGQARVDAEAVSVGMTLKARHDAEGALGYE